MRKGACLSGLQVSLCLLVLLAVMASPARAEATASLDMADPRSMRFPPVEFHPPEPERLVLENGMVVYLLEDHELPLVTVSATIRTGGWLDPPDKVGLASLVAVAMRTGGSQRMSAAAIDEELDRLGAQFSIVIGRESGVATLDLLAKDLGRGMAIFADVLRRPAFEPERVEVARLQAIEAIRRRDDHPQSIAAREFPKLLYGPQHPLARESSVASVSRISREDLFAFHAKSFHPNGMILGVTGDFDRTAMLALLRELFGDWTPGEVQPVAFPPLGAEAGLELRYVSKETSQTHLRVGHLSVKEDDPDYPALVLLNDILGGGSFRSRLFQDVRRQQGLAYSVGSVLRPGHRERGIWAMRTETKSESTQETISRLVANLERLRESPVTDEELEEAKDAFVNSFVFSFSSPAAIVNRRIQLEYDGLPKDFLQQLRDKVVKLTKEDLLRAARAHLHPDRLKILAVGPPDAAKVLTKFGEVKEIKLEPEG